MDSFQEIMKKSQAVVWITENCGHINIILKGEKSRVSQMLEKAIQNSDSLREVLTVSLPSVATQKQKSKKVSKRC